MDFGEEAVADNLQSPRAYDNKHISLMISASHTSSLSFFTDLRLVFWIILSKTSLFNMFEC